MSGVKGFFEKLCRSLNPLRFFLHEEAQVRRGVYAGLTSGVGSFEIDMRDTLSAFSRATQSEAL